LGSPNEHEFDCKSDPAILLGMAGFFDALRSAVEFARVSTNISSERASPNYS
jgi:hypothetical protein